MWNLKNKTNKPIPKKEKLTQIQRTASGYKEKESWGKRAERGRRLRGINCCCC